MRLEIRRAVQALGVAAAVLLTMGASDNAVRYNELGHKMMCICSCNQVLIECNHLGCPDSERMLGELRTAVGKGETDTAVLESFQAEYGPTVLAAPMLTSFNKAAWFVPPLVLLAGIVTVMMLVRNWRLRTVAMPAVASDPQSSAVRDRIRRETEL